MNWWIHILSDLLPFFEKAVKCTRGRKRSRLEKIAALLQAAQKHALDCGAAELAELNKRHALIRRSERLLAGRPGVRRLATQAIAELDAERDSLRHLIKLWQSDGTIPKPTQADKRSANRKSSSPRRRRGQARRQVDSLLSKVLFDPTAATATRKAVKASLLEGNCLDLRQGEIKLVQYERQASIIKKSARLLNGIPGTKAKVKELLAKIDSLRDLKRATIMIGKAILEIHRRVPTAKASLVKMVAREQAARRAWAEKSRSNTRARPERLAARHQARPGRAG